VPEGETAEEEEVVGPTLEGASLIAGFEAQPCRQRAARQSQANILRVFFMIFSLFFIF
jgi:hypothetical protein